MEHVVVLWIFSLVQAFKAQAPLIESKSEGVRRLNGT